MAKRVDHDATMEVSTSQLVPDPPIVKRRPPPVGPQNDMSMWQQVVVGTDDFAPAAPKTGNRRWLIFVVFGVIAAGVGIVVLRSLDDDAPAVSPPTIVEPPKPTLAPDAKAPVPKPKPTKRAPAKPTAKPR